MRTIIDNGEELTVTEEQHGRLLTANMIYVCKCGGCGFSHLEPGVTFEQVETFLKS
jgi:hypothetical protein